MTLSASVHPAAARLDAIHALAEAARTAIPIGINSIVIDADGVPCISRAPQSASLRFVLDGLIFHVAISPDDPTAGSCDCQIWSEAGIMPFTAQSPEKRQPLLAILRNSEGLPHVRFVLDATQRILLFSSCRLQVPVMPDDLIYHLVRMIQEARPYLRLLAQFL